MWGGRASSRQRGGFTWPDAWPSISCRASAPVVDDDDHMQEARPTGGADDVRTPELISASTRTSQSTRSGVARGQPWDRRPGASPATAAFDARLARQPRHLVAFRLGLSCAECGKHSLSTVPISRSQTRLFSGSPVPPAATSSHAVHATRVSTDSGQFPDRHLENRGHVVCGRLRSRAEHS